MPFNKDERWFLLADRIRKMEAQEGVLRALPERTQYDHELREAYKKQYGEYFEWTKERRERLEAKLKRMYKIRFTWVVELTNLSCENIT